MSQFDKRETITVENNMRGANGVAAIYVHRDTGLVVGVSDDHCIFNGAWIKANARPEMEILKHVWVEAWYTGETASYWVGDLDDIPQLEELLKETAACSITIAVSRDFIQAAIEVL